MSLLGDFSNIDNTLTGDTNLQSLTVSDFTCDFINGLDGTKLVNLTNSTSDLQTQINSIVAGGSTPNISIGTTSTLVAGSAATVVQSGSISAPVFSFGIPAGVAGTNGVSPILSVGTTTTLAAGSAATVVISGTVLAPIYSFGIPQGIQGVQGIQGGQGVKGDTGDTGAKGDKGDAGTDGGGALAGAAAGTISGGIAGTASGGVAGTSAGAAAGAEAAATAYEVRVSTLETQSTYFLKSAFPPTETCSAILRVKDTAGISTVHNFDQNGLYTLTGGLSLSSGSSYPFTVNSTGDLTSNSITTTNIKSSTNLNLNFSNPLGGTQINIGKNTGGISPNYINIGSLVDTVYINELPYVPFNINTSFVNQVL